MVLVSFPHKTLMDLATKNGEQTGLAGSTLALADMAEAFKDCMASICAPLSVVTAEFAGRPHGTSVSAFASLSLDPPMVLVSLNNNSELLPVIERSGRFGLNILSSGQADLGMQFGRKGIDRFDGVSWNTTAGVPRLDEVAAWAACELHKTVDGGDHKIVLGTVIRAEHAESAPLLYYKRQFGTYTSVRGRLEAPVD